MGKRTGRHTRKSPKMTEPTGLALDKRGFGILHHEHRRIFNTFMKSRVYPDDPIKNADRSKIDGRIWQETPLQQYMSFHESREHWLGHMRHAWKELFKEQDVLLEGATVVDIGCGTGGLAEVIPLHKATEVIGLDWNKKALQFLREAMPMYSSIAVLDLMKSFLPDELIGKADTVVSLSTVDTLDEVDEFAAHTANILKERGKAVILQDLNPEIRLILNKYSHLGLVIPISNKDYDRNFKFAVIPFSEMMTFLEDMEELLITNEENLGVDNTTLMFQLLSYVYDPMVFHMGIPMSANGDALFNKKLQRIHSNISDYWGIVLQKYREKRGDTKVVEIDPQIEWQQRIIKAFEKVGLKIKRSGPISSSEAPILNTKLLDYLTQIEKAIAIKSERIRFHFNAGAVGFEFEGEGRLRQVTQKFTGYAVVAEKPQEK